MNLVLQRENWVDTAVSSSEWAPREKEIQDS